VSIEVCRDPHGTSLQRVAVDHTPQPCKVINNLSDWFVAGTIVVFDEYFGYHGWQRHEHKAFQEFLSRTGLSFEAIGLGHMNLAVRLING
jgi:hypothetical protein